MKMESRRPRNDTDLFLEKFSGVEQLFEHVQFGFSLLDRELLYLFVNDRMAMIDGKSIEQHVGRSFKEVDPQIALVVEPILRRALKEQRPILELAVEIPQGVPGLTTPDRIWQVYCFPLMAADETIVGVSLVVQDVTEQKLKEAAQVERLKFEALLSDLSATFINLPVSEVDGKIVQGLQKIVDFLGFDRSSVWRVDPDNGQMICTHSHALPGINQPPTVLLPGVLPVWNSMVHHDEIFKVSDVDELPDNFWREKKYCKERGGIRSIMFIPACVGGVVVGFITFVSYSVKRAWPDDLIQRLRILWEVFANALERKRADQKIQRAMAEIEILKDRLEAENLYLRD